jgi:hypothetical protein
VQRQVEQFLRSNDAVTHRHARVLLLSSRGKKVPRFMPLVGISERRFWDSIHGLTHHDTASRLQRKAPGMNATHQHG